MALRVETPSQDIEVGRSLGIVLGQFFFVGVGGFVLGVIFGLVAAFIIMFTRRVGALAPLVSRRFALLKPWIERKERWDFTVASCLPD